MKDTVASTDLHHKISANYKTISGHYDEWKRGNYWDELITRLDELGPLEMENLQTSGADILKDNGFSFAEFSEQEHDSRGHELDPIPVILAEEEYSFIQEALKQRAFLLNYILKDSYEEQSLIKQGLIHPSFLYSQPRYNRSLVNGYQEKSAYLNVYATDLVRDANGNWVVVKDYTEAPSGLGLVLEHRIATSKIFSDISKEQHLVRLVQFFQDYRESLHKQAPSGVDDPLVVLLSSKVQDSSYFEDVFLCQYLGIPLVDGEELTVRDDRVYLKTVSGLMRIHVIIRKIKDSESDPLASPHNSQNGVPGLMEVIKRGNVRILNPPGSGILETYQLYKHLPNICQHITGSPLMISSGHEHNLACSTSPAWRNGALSAQPIKFRFYTFFDGESYQVMPGGLATYQLPTSTSLYCKDVWVITSRQNESTIDANFITRSLPIKRNTGLLSSRAADNLFWLGRYAERSEYATRTILEIVLNITEEEQRTDLSSIKPILTTLEKAHFLPKGFTSIEENCKNHHNLFTTLCSMFYNNPTISKKGFDSIPNCLVHLTRLTTASRARLSNEMSHITREAEALTHSKLPTNFVKFRKVLVKSIIHYSAFNGTCLYNLTRTRGWHFITIGKQIESVSWLINLTNTALKSYPEVQNSLLDSILSINDSTLTYRFRYQSAPQLAYVLDLVLYDPANPRSLYTHLHNIHKSLQVLVAGTDSFNKPIVLSIRKALCFLETEIIQLDSPEHYQKSIIELQEFIEAFKKEIPLLSEKLGWEFFTHVNYRSS